MRTQLHSQTNVVANASYAPLQVGVLQRNCACGGSAGFADKCEDCDKKKLSLQRSTQDSELETRNSKPETPNSAGVPPIVNEVLRSSGQPLDAATRAFMEPRFGHDFSQVQIHTDERAAASAETVNALAYTVGRDIVFGSGQFSSRTQSGQSLLAHELTHVVQNDLGPKMSSGPAIRSHHDAPDERQAREVSHAVSSGDRAPAVAHYATPSAHVQARDIGPVESAAAYLPDTNQLQTELTAKTVPERVTFIAAYLAPVKVKWGRADALGLIAMLDKVRSAETKMATNATKPVAGLPQNAPAAFREGLMLDAGGTASTALGRQLVLGLVTVDSVSATPAVAVNAVMNLRRLDDVLTRILSAQAVAAATGTPINDVLAMYRTEGDLNAPPSQASLSAKIPPGKTDATTSLNPRPDITNLVWLIDSRIAGTDAEHKEFALTEWFVQIGGLDQVGGLAAPQRASFSEWSGKNWLRAAGVNPDAAVSPAEQKRVDDEKDLARLRWDGLVANMALEKPLSESGVSTAIKVTPVDSELLVSGILKEAVMLQRALGKTSSLLGTSVGAAPVEMTKGMSYLQYHAGTDQMKQIIASAVIAASRTNSATFKTLRTALATVNVHDLKSWMTAADADRQQLEMPGIDPAERTRLKTDLGQMNSDMWTVVSGWAKADATHLPLLSEFIEKADNTIWSAWTEHRGNLSRYNVLDAYYSLL